MLSLLLALTPAHAEDEAGQKNVEAIGIPLVNYSTAMGLGYGVGGAGMWRGEKDPYTLRFVGQIYGTTRDYAKHFALLEAPSVAGSKTRLELTLRWFSWLDAPYFGEGNDAVLTGEPDDPETRYEQDGPTVLLNARRDLVGAWDVLLAGQVRHAKVDYELGSLVDRDRPIGYRGGWTNILGMGIVYDDRDLEPNPHDGAWSELSVWASHDWLGSSDAFAVVDATDRRWRSLGQRWVVANRATVDVQLGDVPLVMSGDLAGTRPVPLGGPWTLRGYEPNRLRGDVIALLQPELRWTFARPQIRGGPADFMVAGFSDLGRVWTDAADPLGRWWPSAGGGLRGCWHDALLLRADVAWALERYADGTSGPVRGVYIMVDHPY